MASNPPYPPGSSLGAALELVEARRAALIERVALEMHDALAAEGASFPQVREVATAWVEAVTAALAGRYAPSAVSLLDQAALRSLDAGVSLGAVVASVQAAIGAFLAVAGEHAPQTVAPIARAAGGLGGEVAATAARSLEERARMQLKRRSDRADRFRDALGRIAAAALDAGGALQELARAGVSTLDCDWAAVAMREGGGRLGIAALEGRGVGWAQRWSLSESEGFCARVLKSGQPVTTADPALMSYAGADRPAAIVAAPIRSAGGDALGVLFAGRDHGALPDEDDAAAAAGLAEIGARALETAQPLRRRARQRRADGLPRRRRRAGRGRRRPARPRAGRARGARGVRRRRRPDPRPRRRRRRGRDARRPGTSAALAAELEGTRVPASDNALAELLAGRALPSGGLTDSAVSAPCVERLGPIEAAALPISADGRRRRRARRRPRRRAVRRAGAGVARAAPSRPRRCSSSSTGRARAPSAA